MFIFNTENTTFPENITEGINPQISSYLKIKIDIFNYVEMKTSEIISDDR